MATNIVFVLLCTGLTSVAYAAVELPPIYVSPSGGVVSPEPIEKRSVLISSTHTADELPPIYVSPSGGIVSSEVIKKQSQKKNPSINSLNNPPNWQLYDHPNATNKNQSNVEKEKSGFEQDDSYSKNGFKETSNSNNNPISSYLKNFNYGVTLQTDQKPNVYFEGVLPLYQSFDKKSTFFTHDRISIQGDNEGVFSAGLGYRKLVLEDELLVGANSFFDYQQNYNHSRLGFGLEAFSKGYEFRSNFYFGLSPARLVKETEPYYYYEKVADGYDFEAGGGYPDIPWLKTFFGFSKYTFDRSADELKITGRIQIKPSKFLTLNIIGNRNQTTNSNQFGVDSRFSLLFYTFKPEDILADIKDMWRFDESEGSGPENLTAKALDRVERNFSIVVEKWKEPNIVPLPVGSGGSIQVQLIWDRNNMNDLDMHLLLPAGVGDNDHIYYTTPESHIGADLFANLDVDDIPLRSDHANHSGRDHVENIYVVSGMARAGSYTPYVHVYDFTSDVTATINVFKEGVFIATYTNTFTADDQTFYLPAITYP